MFAINTMFVRFPPSNPILSTPPMVQVRLRAMVFQINTGRSQPKRSRRTPLGSGPRPSGRRPRQLKRLSHARPADGIGRHGVLEDYGLYESGSKPGKSGKKMGYPTPCYLDLAGSYALKLPLTHLHLPGVDCGNTWGDPF